MIEMIEKILVYTAIAIFFILLAGAIFYYLFFALSLLCEVNGFFSTLVVLIGIFYGVIMLIYSLQWLGKK